MYSASEKLLLISIVSHLGSEWEKSLERTTSLTFLNGFEHTSVHRGIKTNGKMILNQSWGVLFTKFEIQEWRVAKAFCCEVVQGHALSVRAGKKGVVRAREQWPLHPRGHAPLRSLAEGNLFAQNESSLAARHRGAEEKYWE
jgi:hypothetical protein